VSRRLADYDFEFPEELIASEPAEPRDSAKLMVVDAGTGRREQAVFSDLARWLKPGDCLVVNASKVLPCRLLGKKATGGRADVLLVKELEAGTWTALSSGLKPGTALVFGAEGEDSARAEVLSLNDDGEYVLRFDAPDLMAFLRRRGLAPLPPYISKRKKEFAGDRERYQTVYAEKEGSIAAPTAGLHFTPGLLENLERSGVRVAKLVLHVGRGTFRPIVADDVEAHEMLPEHYLLPAEEARKISSAAASGGRVVAVGTTSMRTIESLARRPEGFGPGEGWTDLFIRPGHEFKIARGLITNFHWPKSTPLLLASAFLGREKLLEAYQEAFRERFRLFSYGDAMLILK